jgi:signal transduction histidine kinase
MRSPRWSADDARRLLWPAGAAVGIAAEAAVGGAWAPDLLTGWLLIGCGLVAWARRPANACGALLTATGFAWFAPNLLGAPALYLYRGPLVALVLTYPRGRPAGRLETAAVVAGCGAAVVAPVWGSAAATVTLSALMIAAAARAYRGASGRERRMRRRGLQAAAGLAVLFATVAGARLAGAGEAATLYAFDAALAALAVALTVGLLRAPWEHPAIADLVVELSTGGSRTLRDALAHALGDPSLEVGYRFAGTYVDAAGRPLGAARLSGRATTPIDWHGARVGLLIHDPAVLRDPALLDGIATAARLAAANARLQAEVRAQVGALAESRRRLIAAADEERARLTRRLGTGAQARLERLGVLLAAAGRSAAGDDEREAIGAAQTRLDRTREELGRLARGIHPRELAEHGLAAALRSLAEASPLPLDLSLHPVAAGPDAEACAYFVCAEALANAAKHARASAVTVSVDGWAGALRLCVDDDGAGGADADGGSGLRGARDRVEALGGTFAVSSPRGGGTRLTAVIPGAGSPAESASAAPEESPA